MNKEAIIEEYINNEDKVVVLNTENYALNTLHYSLPKTGMRFIITSEKTKKKRGDFYQYSERYLGLKDVILQDETEWQIKDIKLETFGIANLDKTYAISNGKGIEAPSISLTQDGVIISVNNTKEENTKELTCKMISSEDKAREIPYTEAMLRANSRAKMAEEAARYIYQLRDSRTTLLSSDLNVLPPDGEAYKINLQKINELEESFTSLFKGKATKTTVVETIEILPEKLLDKSIIFRFSSFGGVVDKSDMSGSPIYLSMELGEYDHQNVNLPDSAGFFYNKPAPVTLRLSEGKNEILSEKIFMSQFGEVVSLPIGSIRAKTKIEFYQSTGAIKAIKQ